MAESPIDRAEVMKAIPTDVAEEAGAAGAAHGPTKAVIGLGNEIAGDDGVGLWIAVCLRRLLRHHADVEVIALPWAGFDLLEAMLGHRRVALVDCVQTGKHEPGTILHLSENDLQGSVRLNSYHDLNYPTILALGRKMGLPMPEIIKIWGIEGGQVSTFSSRISPPVRRSAVQVMREVLDFLGISRWGV